MIGLAPTTGTSITVKWPSHLRHELYPPAHKSRSETPNMMCSTCQTTIGDKKTETNLKNRTTTVLTQGLSFAFWHHAANGASTQPFPRQTTKDVIMETSARKRSASQHSGDVKNQPFQSATLSQNLTMMMSMGYKTSQTQTFQLQTRTKTAKTLGLKEQPSIKFD